MTLLLQYRDDWIALINRSSIALSLEGVEFQRESRTLKATAWGRNVLRPGECLRIYKDDNPPNALPPKCVSAIDYAAPKDEREIWLDGPVTIVINPATTYCFPSEKCP